MALLWSYGVRFDRHADARIRTKACKWLSDQVSVRGDVLDYKILRDGFQLDGRRVPLLSRAQGIFKPAVMDVPLSIRTSPGGPYDDELGTDNLLEYRYRGIDPQHRDNVGLRFAMHQGLPLAYFLRVEPSRYRVRFPVYVVDDVPEFLTFWIVVNEALVSAALPDLQDSAGQVAEIHRRYVTAQTRRRLHQRVFRERVLSAYCRQCALCRLGHDELLDAAHIRPDSEPGGDPVVRNGIALCRLHHAAFDRFFLAVRPDHVITVRDDILSESDGPTLRHAIQGLHGRTIVLPRKPSERPDTGFLTERYERFLRVAASR